MTKDQAIEVLVNHVKNHPEPAPSAHGHPEDFRDDYNEWRERRAKVTEAVVVLSVPVVVPLPPGGWIKSTDRLPENDIVCWVVIAATQKVEVRCFNSHWKCWDGESGDDFMNKIEAVSHWQPLIKPAAPLVVMHHNDFKSFCEAVGGSVETPPDGRNQTSGTTRES